MKKYQYLLLFFSTFLPCLLSAQTKQITNQQLAWYGYFTTVEFSPKWRLATDFHERHFFDPVAQHQWLLRTRLYRSLGRGWEAAVGFVYLQNNPNDPCTEGCLSVPELRPYQEFQYRQSLGKWWSLRHRYVIEERFARKTANGILAPGHVYTWRFRYLIGADLDLFRFKKEGQAVRLRLAEEIMANAGKKVGANIFDQNRLYIGFLVPFSKNMSFELGYMHLIQERSTGDKFYNRHIMRVGLNHKIKMR